MAGILDRAAGDINKVTKAQGNQETSAKMVAAATTTHQKSVADLSKSYHSYVAELEKGNRRTDEATDHLKRFSKEFAKLSNRAPVGSQMADDMLKASKAAKKLADEIDALEADHKKRSASIVATSKKQLDAVVKDINTRVKAEQRGAAAEAVAAERLAAQRVEAERKAAAEISRAQEKLQKDRAASIIAAAKEHLAVTQQEIKERVEGEKKAASEIASSQQKLSAQRAAAESEAEKATQKAIAATEAARARDAQRTLDQVHAQRNLRQEVEDSVRAYDDFIDRVRAGEVAGKDVEAGLQQHAARLSRLGGRAEPGSPPALSAAGGAREARDLIRSLGQEEQRATTRAGGLRGALDRLFAGGASEKAERIEKSIEALDSELGKGAFSAIRFAGTLRSLVYVGVFVFFQELASAAIALGGALVSVASAAVQAGGAIVGALAAGAAQALPVIGLLGAAWGRVGAVFKAVQQNIKEHTQAAFDNAQAADRQRTAAQGVQSAQESLTRAQEALNKAEADGVRQIEDLIAAQRQAELQARSAALAQSDAQRALTSAIGGGDVGQLAQLQLQADQAQEGVLSASRARARARADAATAVAGGVQGLPSVVSARQSVQDSRRALGDARQAASETVKQVATANRLLQQMLAQLSPAERGLYSALNRLYERYRKLFVGDKSTNGLLSPIIDAFTRGTDALYRLLGDRKLIATATKLADTIGRTLGRAFDFLTSSKVVGFIEDMATQARRNLPTVEDILQHIVDLFMTIARAGSGAFSKLLGFIDDALTRADDGTKDGSGFSRMERFFDKGAEYAESFGKLAYAVIQLVGAIIGASAQQGGNVIDSITANVNKATDWINDNRGKVKQFFSDAIQASGQIAKVVGTLAVDLFKLFDPQNVEAFSRALRNTVLPALVSVATTIGHAASIFTDLVDSGPGSDVAKFFLIVTLLQTTLGKLSGGLLRFVRGWAAVLGAEGAVGVLNTLIKVSGPIGLTIFAVATAIGILSGHISSIKDVLKAVGGTLAAILIFIYGGRGLVAGLRLVYGGLEDVAAAGLLGRLGGIGAAFGTILVHVLALIRRLPILRGLLATTAVQAPIVVGSTGATRGGVVVPTTAGITRAGAAAETSAITGAEATVGVAGAAGVAKLGLGAVGKIALPIAALTALFTFLSTHGSVVDRVRAVASTFTFGLIHGPSQGASGITPSGVQRGIVNLLTPSTGAEIHPAGTAPGTVRTFDILATSVAQIKKAIDDQLRNKSGDPYILERLFGANFEHATKEQLDAALKQVQAFGPKYQRYLNFLPTIKKAIGQVTADDILDPQAAAEFSDNIRRMKVAGVRSMDDLRTNIQFNVDLISKAFTSGSADWTAAMAKNFQTSIQAVKKAMRDHVIPVKQGLKEIRDLFRQEFNLYGFTNEQADNILKGQSSTGGPEEGTRGPGHAIGGWVGSQGQRGADTVRTWLGKGEAVLNWAHQRVVEPAMRATYGFGLDEMFRSTRAQHGSPSPGGMAAGGAAGGGDLFDGHPGNVNANLKRLIQLLKSRFALSVQATTDHDKYTTNGKVSDHFAGNAVDLSGARDVMYNAAQYVKSSRLYRSLKQGIHNPNLSVNLGKMVSSSFWGPKTWAQHISHLHLAIVGALNAAAAGATGALGRIRRVKIDDPLGGPLKRIGQRGLDRTRGLLNKVLEAASGADVGAEPDAGLTISDVGDLQSINKTYPAHDSGNARGHTRFAQSLVERIARWAGLPGRIFGLIAKGESSFYPGILGHDPGGTTGYGLWQNTTRVNGSAFERLVQKLGGWMEMLNPLKNAKAARWLYDRGGLSHWRGTRYLKDAGYAAGGMVKGALGKAVPIVAHAGEWVVNRLQQSKLAQMLGTSVGGLRGAMGFSGGPTSFAGGGQVGAFAERAVPPTFEALSGEFDRAQGIIARLSTSIIGKKFTDKLSKSLAALYGDGGLLDQISDSITTFSDKIASNLTLLTFGLDKSGDVIRTLSDTEVADKVASNLQRVGERLQSELSDLQSQLEDVDKRLGAKGLTGAQRQLLESTKANVQKRLAGVQQALGDNLSSTFDAVESAIQARSDAASAVASRALGRLDRTDRLRAILGPAASALGVASAGVVGRQRAVALTNQANSTQAAAALASSRGHQETAQALLDTVADLRVQVAEAVKASFEADAQDIQDRADRASTSFSRSGRVADVLQAAGNTAGAFAIRGQGLLNQGESLTRQQNELGILRAQALAAGQTQVAQDLQDKIEDLSVSIQENTEAQKDNTTATRQASIDAITARGSFLTGVFGGLGGILTGLTRLTGQDTLPGQRSLLQNAGQALSTTGAGLSQKLFEGFGVDVRGLTPQGLASFFTNFDFDKFEAGLSAADRAQFEGLVTSIIGNTTAIVDNTQQLQALTGNDAQSFSSSFWRTFRTAIFNGAGTLLPQYQLALPHAASGANILRTGALIGHTGETIVPAHVSQYDGADGGDTYNTYITKPTEVLDTTDVGRELAFVRRVRGRRR